MASNFFIGIDAGTTSIKAVLMGDDGEIVAMAMEEYALEMQQDRCEIEANLYLEKAISVIRQLTKSNRELAKNIRALSFSSQGETLICVDHEGSPLRKAIVWLDNRSLSEAVAIEAKFGAEEICRRTGQPQVQPLWPATRISWLRTHEPLLFQSVHKFLLVEDYLIFKFTGKFVGEQTLASSTLYYDIRQKQWWPEMLTYLQISEERLPDIYPSGTVAGIVLQPVAQETGLPSTTSIVTGAYDHVAGALGAGNFQGGAVSETTGTSMAMVVTLDKPIPNYVINLPMQCHAIPGKYLLLPYGQTAGFVLKWFKDQFCQQEVDEKKDDAEIYDRLIEQAEHIPPGCDGLIMLPHLMGSGSPEFNSHARGVIAGITAATTKGHFIRAILEAIACMMKRNLDLLKASGIHVKEIKALGGGSKSKLWNQIKADVSNIPITTVQGQETAAIGAAILAATGSGFFCSIEAACNKMVNLSQTFIPDPKRHKVYEGVYARYVNLTHNLEKYWEA
ncbi:FGGY family carbohydrate kinase [Chryseolinea sp. H1M3-3]|uniref:xylulokinase n=1 Tax=Chryseolinea sp. H1M3-3 TaxID=3034144 RepID=UPI0023EC2649|nr:FGGY family carbohydrate kinase [Chryseolinea sp. H1M3-3]